MSNPEKLYSMKILRYIVKSKFTSCMATLLAMVATACMDYGPRPMEQINRPGKGVFIMNEGNFQYGNASLSYYNPET